MTEWEFDLVFADIEDVDEAHEALFNAGCDDVTVSYSNGEVCLSFIREAEGFAQAVIGALSDVTKAHMGGTLIRIAPDDLVSASDIARRAEVSREAVRKWASSGLPPATNYAGASPLRSWYEVVGWLQGRDDRRGVASPYELERSKQILAFNERLRHRRFAKALNDAVVRDFLGEVSALVKER